MNRSPRLFITGVFCVALASLGTAQDILEQHYGSGVHAFFAGNTDAAAEYFDDVINAGSQDPRAFYFRGLTQILTQGGCMIEAGFPDFEQAAYLELTGKRSSDVSKALARIQGPTRIAIERIRAKARLAAKSQQFEMMRDKFEQPGTAGTTLKLPDEKAPTEPSAAANPTDPFAEGTGLTEGTPAPMPVPATPEPPAPDFPPAFENPPVPDAAMPAPDASNPFADEPAPAAPSPPIPPAPSDDPFGT